MIAAPFDVTDRVVLVTGAGRGIGRGVAQVLAAAGADVALNARTEASARTAADEIAATTGRRAVAVPGDMTDPAAVGGAVRRVLDELGPIDVLVNGVGDGMFRPLVDMDVADLEHQVDVNLRATLLACRAVGAHLVARGAGRVINISSIGAARPTKDMAVYSAGKAAVEGLTRALALEWAPFDVTVNCIAPGVFPDPDRSQIDPELADTLRARIPLGRLGDVHDVGHLVRYLASPASAYLTGQTITLDGGMTL